MVGSTERAGWSSALGLVNSLATAFCLLVGGCSSSSNQEKPHSRAPKVNIPDFIKKPAAYKGKSITLALKVDRTAGQGQGQSFRDYVGRDVKFIAFGPKGERLSIVVSIPAGLAIPDLDSSEEVIVRFVCSGGNLRQGNVAKSIEKR